MHAHMYVYLKVWVWVYVMSVWCMITFDTFSTTLWNRQVKNKDLGFVDKETGTGRIKSTCPKLQPRMPAS